MSFILAIILGGTTGYIAQNTVPTRQNQSLAIINGAAGGLLGLWFFSDILKIDPIVSFGTISLLNGFFGLLGSIFFIAVTEHTMKPQKSVKKYETTVPEQKTVNLEPIFTHQYEDVKIKKKKDPKK
jgi:uncharacterized membrane protein YeaQ/YmgE (transglycosylase-associated protein family)